MKRGRERGKKMKDKKMRRVCFVSMKLSMRCTEWIMEAGRSKYGIPRAICSEKREGGEWGEGNAVERGEIPTNSPGFVVFPLEIDIILFSGSPASLVASLFRGHVLCR